MKRNFSNLLVLFLFQSVPVLVSAESNETPHNLTLDYARKCGELKNIFSLRDLKLNESVSLIIKARSHWNASRILFKKNADYKISVNTQDKWCDANIVTTYLGWKIIANKKEQYSYQCPDECAFCKNGEVLNGPGVNLGKIKNTLISNLNYFKRQPDYNWFSLIGVHDGQKQTHFKISNNMIYHSQHDGEFCAYANDSSLFYNNNSGELSLVVKRVQ